MKNEFQIKGLWLDESKIYIETQKGEIKSHSLEWFPRLWNATTKQRSAFELSPFGIHWPELDEDQNFEGFFNYSKELVK